MKKDAYACLCVVCGDVFRGYHHGLRYCDKQECQDEKERIRKERRDKFNKSQYKYKGKNVQNNCRICGKQFTIESIRFYCSKECQKEAHNYYRKNGLI